MTIDFDPAKYDLLDKAPLEEWIKQFLLRNREFIKDWKRLVIKHDPNDSSVRINHIYKKQRELFSEWKVRVHSFYTGTKAIEKELIISISRVSTALRVGEPEQMRSCLNKSFSIGNDANVENFFYPQKLFFESEERRCEILDLLFASDYDHIEDLLFVSINLRNTKTAILAAVKKLLDIHWSKNTGNQHVSIWKYYLMAYDLHSKELTYQKIADILYDAYPDYRPQWDAKNVENYVKACRDLIRGGYKKYI